MNTRILALMTLAVLMMAMLAWLNQRGAGDADPDIGRSVLPGLKQDLARVTKLTLHHGSETTTISRAGKGWVVEEKEAYPVNFEQFSSLLDALAGSTLRERKTSKQENHSSLGVDEASAVGLEIEVAGSTLGLLLGNASSSSSGLFVRYPGENQVWLAAGMERVEADPSGWIEAGILNVPSEEVARATLVTGEGTLDARRDEASGDLVLVDLPDDAELRYDTIVNSLGRALVNVSANDVRARADSAWQEAAQAGFQLGDGSRIEVTARQEGADYWARFDLIPSEVPSETVRATDETMLEAYEYRISQYAFDQFTKTLDDMIKVPEAGEPES